jgi:glycosyltransferase involved in cell wall biosynthesis
MTEPQLAIVAPSFGAASETFVARHARELAPGRTLLVCQDGRGAERYGAPVLSHFVVQPTHATEMQRLRNAVIRRVFPSTGWTMSMQDDMRLTAFLRAHGATAVLAEFGPMGALVAPTCARLGIPLSVYFRGFDASAALRNPRTVRRYRRMFPLVANVFAVSQAIAERIVAIGCPPERLHVIPSGVETDRFAPGAPEPGRVIAVGRLTEKKAPHLTIRAFAAAARALPEAQLDLVGDGPLRPLCEAEIAAQGLEGRVTLHGALPHEAVAALVRRAAVFVQHSVTAPNGDTEGLPGAICEAMAAALPVISTRHSGIPEAVVEGETGLLVAEGDAEGMGAALIALLRDPARAAAMGAAGRRRALDRFDVRLSHARVRAAMGLPDPAAA